MSAQNSKEIQKLLQTEKKAHEIVQKARGYRTQKLKDAKTDAAADIEAYKKKKEEDFSKTKNADSGSNTKAEAEAEESAKSELAEIKKAGEKAEKDVLKKLIDEVLTPKPIVHINA
ncbi:YALIA101S05e11540g1_1 [Yarrowia lipolytica]|nr:V-type proton ATPase subunit G [Yarrowia lipolytica]SEI34824.1 YALIA101S05e11540g1_1 [Yarrowia lipolytica]